MGKSGVLEHNFRFLAWSKWMAFGLRRAKVLVGLIVCAVSFQDIQPLIVVLIHQRHRQTDGQTDGRHAITIPCFAVCTI